MKALTAKSEQDYYKLKTTVESNMDTLASTISLPSFEYNKTVEKFKKIDQDCFSYSIHGKDYFVRTEYILAGQAYAAVYTSKSEYDYDSYPNRKLTPIKSLDMKISLTEDITINNKPIKDFPTDYLTAVTDFMYPDK